MLKSTITFGYVEHYTELHSFGDVFFFNSMRKVLIPLHNFTLHLNKGVVTIPFFKFYFIEKESNILEKQKIK